MNAMTNNSSTQIKKSCRISDCTRPVRAKGLCSLHYQRERAHGDPLISRQGQRPKRDPWSLFMQKVTIQANDCWIWTGAMVKGYGVLTVDKKRWRAHVWAWVQKHGERPRYPDGHRLAGRVLPLDHFKCDTPACVNPDHVRPVTDRENSLRSGSPTAFNAAKTQCPVGHELSGENVWIDSKGGRNCRTCRRRSWRETAARARSRNKSVLEAL